MLKIAVFGFFHPDQTRVSPSRTREIALTPASTDDFMRAVAALAPNAPTGYASGAPCFVKLSDVIAQPVYVQSLSDRMAPGAGLLNCDGYVAIVDAVKILAPRTIESALRRLHELHPRAHVIIAAGRQNEPEALSSEEIREVLGLHHDLPVYPYVPGEPKTAQRLIRRLARYISDPARKAPPIFAGSEPPAEPEPVAEEPLPAAPTAPEPHIQGLDHVMLAVRDTARALDFYRGLLGFRVVSDTTLADGTVVNFLDLGRNLLGLCQQPDSPEGRIPTPPAGTGQIVLRVVGLDDIADQLMCADAPCLLEPTEMSGRRMAYFSDPDGNVIGLVEGETRAKRR
ncbi:MAG TPA: VOC family protein [Aggregatilinea sp.]|jgi:glyoxylase I family protein|uniref:VOC family protein n=1 Tax=Aggregatilinea sp. TaxID=2806333 RepID=UPI002C026A88|nr:VOC family protein [Aggregatilinea sp.]HML24033.1 VOC family protein [Aggregatilinea sp.]